MDVFHPSSCINANIRATTRVITQFYDAVLKPSGLLSTQFSLMAALIEAEPISVTELADLLGMDRTTLARNLSPLERDGWLVIAVGEVDKRQRIVTLTDAGRERYQQALNLWLTAQTHLIDHFGATNWEALLVKLQSLSAIAQETSA